MATDEKKPDLLTFHRVREQCEHADAGAWRAFLTLYGPLGLYLLGMYAPEGAASDSAFVKTLRALAENNFERFRATARQSEREFLADVRALLLDLVTEGDTRGGAGEASVAAPEAAAAPDAASKDGLSPERLAALLDGLRCFIRKCFSSSWPVIATAALRRCCAWPRAWRRSRLRDCRRISPRP
jgi:hypothetical protein